MTRQSRSRRSTIITLPFFFASYLCYIITITILLLSGSIVVFVQGEIDAMTGMECVDKNEQCPFWAATGDCDTNRNFMGIECRKSCNRCKFIRVQNEAEMKAFMEAKKIEVAAKRKAAKEKADMMKALEGNEEEEVKDMIKDEKGGEEGKKGDDNSNENKDENKDEL